MLVVSTVAAAAASFLFHTLLTNTFKWLWLSHGFSSNGHENEKCVQRTSKAAKALLTHTHTHTTVSLYLFLLHLHITRKYRTYDSGFSSPPDTTHQRHQQQLTQLQQQQQRQQWTRRMGKSLQWQWQWHYHHHQLQMQLQLQPEIVVLPATVRGTLLCLYFFFSCSSPRHTIIALTNARLMRHVRIRYIMLHATVMDRYTTFTDAGDL